MVAELEVHTGYAAAQPGREPPTPRVRVLQLQSDELQCSWVYLGLGPLAETAAGMFFLHRLTSMTCCGRSPGPLAPMLHV